MSGINLAFLAGAESGNLTYLKECLSKDADILTTSPYQNLNALHAAVSRGHEETVRYLTQEHPLPTATLIHGEDNEGDTPLLKLVCKSEISKKIFDLLSSAGAKFNHANKNKYNALHHLAKFPKNVSFLKLALDRLAEVDALAEVAMGKTLHKIAGWTSPPIAQLIASYSFEGQKTEALNCRAGYQEEFLETPLHIAISSKNKEAVAVLRDGTNLSLKKGKKTLEEALKEFDKNVS